MTHCSCCVINCKSTSRNSKCKFYKFPSASWKLEQRNKWVAAVKKINDDGSPWSPKPYDYICSDHFVGGKKSEELLNPSWVPTIFPTAYRAKEVNKAAVISRHKRFIERRLRQEPTPTIT